VLTSGDAKRPWQICDAAINHGAIGGGIHGFRQNRACGGSGNIGRRIAHFSDSAGFCGGNALHGKLFAPFGRGFRFRRRRCSNAGGFCLGAGQKLGCFLHGFSAGGFSFLQLRFSFKAELIRLINPLADIIGAGIKRTGARWPIRSIYLRDPDNNLVEIAEQWRDA
jgi:catechol 2,3-dioxygenase-like lactoylglutathione lyase family enzyme